MCGLASYEVKLFKGCALTNYRSHANVSRNAAASLLGQSEDSKYITAIPLANATPNVTRTVLLASFFLERPRNPHKIVVVGQRGYLVAKAEFKISDLTYLLLICTLADCSIGIVEMLFCTSLVAIVGAGDQPAFSPRRLQIINTKVRDRVV